LSFVGARAGLGCLILQSAQSFDTAAMFVGVIILAGAGIGSVALLKLLERNMAPWRFENADERLRNTQAVESGSIEVIPQR
jgi:ABC-type nitrate/sulfonate/bicarbonate transport system permease component